MKTCDFCGKAMVLQRSDARFCHVNCRVKFYQHQKKLQDQQAPLRLAAKNLQQQKETLIQQREAFITIGIKAARRIDLLEEDLDNKLLLFNMNHNAFRVKVLDMQDAKTYFPTFEDDKLLHLLESGQNTIHVYPAKKQLKQQIIALRKEVIQSKNKHLQLINRLSQIFKQIQQVELDLQACQQQKDELLTKHQQSLQNKKQRRPTATS